MWCVVWCGSHVGWIHVVLGSTTLHYIHYATLHYATLSPPPFIRPPNFLPRPIYLGGIHQTAFELDGYSARAARQVVAAPSAPVSQVGTRYLGSAKWVHWISFSPRSGFSQAQLQTWNFSRQHKRGHRHKPARRFLLVRAGNHRTRVALIRKRSCSETRRRIILATVAELYRYSGRYVGKSSRSSLYR
ncbi:hypothetical protein F5Y05DRAFT_27984 [Hypoxylon sp. FL0543]|nr:hypothetical protein F5Y05DRAFT_27984 [Hypoxylon sp. FL0543]